MRLFSNYSSNNVLKYFQFWFYSEVFKSEVFKSEVIYIYDLIYAY